MNPARWLDLRFEPIAPLGPGVTLVRDTLAPARAEPCVRKTAREPGEVAALARETDALLSLHHPALRAVRAAAPGVTVLEHVAGEDLAAHLSAHPDRGVPCAAALLRVLLHLHAHGLAHGDLKPANVLVQGDGRLRLIDLGLVTRLGETPLGGTHEQLPPEYLRGSPVSVAGELYAFGATMRAAAGAGARSWPTSLGGLVESCLAANPLVRPASADAALAVLSEGAARLDAAGALPAVETAGLVETCTATCRAPNGRTIVVEAPAGAGRTRLVQTIVRALLAEGHLVADASLAAGHDPLGALAIRIVPAPVPADLEAAASAAVAASARAGAAIVLDDADQSSEDAAAALVAAVRALGVLGKGALVVVGANPALTERLAAAGAVRLALAPLPEAAVLHLARELGLHVDEPTLAAITRATGGRAGAIGRVLTRLAERPETPASEALDLAAALAHAAPEPPEAPAATRAELVARVAGDLAARAGRRALRRIRAAAPALEQDPTADRELAWLAARAHLVAGALAEGGAILEALGDELPAEARLERARVSERRGRYAAALRDAERLLADPDLDLGAHARAAILGGAAALALGRPDDADRIVAAALAGGDGPDAAFARLHAVRSDVALVRGDGGAAVASAERAETLARRAGDPALVAHALARLAAAHGLGGRPARARDAYAAALDAARAASEPAALPPYVMNLATADHALGELGSALRGYEEAARMSERLGRQGTRAAALTNLAGLLASVAADDEARRVLADARAAAEGAGAAIYAAQCTLIEAEVEGRADPSVGAALAARARDAFTTGGAARQALEAELLQHELGLEQGRGPAAAAFCRERRGELAEAGLAARALFAEARATLAAGNLEASRHAAESTARQAHEEGALALEARALALLAEVHRRLGTGADEAFGARARETLGAAAARIPAGLRERFLAAPEHAAVSRTAPTPPPPADAPRGLDGRARRLLALVRRLTLEDDEDRMLEAAVDEAVELTRSERAFLLTRRSGGKTAVVAARNLDHETIKRSRFRYSRSVAERVLETGEPLLTASATEDPLLRGSRSVLDLGLRSILCVPVRGPSGVTGALYLDHRFTAGHFVDGDLEIVQALADIMGVSLEKARLHRELAERAEALARSHEAVSQENERRSAEIARLADALSRAGPTAAITEGGIVGSSPKLARALDVARRIAPSDLPVLVQGESGTGKELVARFVHDRSLRAKGPFVAINCAALPESLLESELFGHVRGAFTGATRDHPGLFRTAEGGTLLLDEIGEMPLRMQTRLLRVLQEGEVQPVGGAGPVRVDVRVIAATNRNLEREAEEGRFRRDLYFRLFGARIELPPLRERREDLGLLGEAILARVAREPGMRRVRLSREALGRMLAYEWPGNVRELEQSLRRAVLVSEGDEILPEDLGLAGGGATRRESLRRFDRALVEEALRAARGSRTAAARALGVSRVTLHRWIRRHEIE